MKRIADFVPVFVRSENNYSMDLASLESGFESDEKSLALQSSAEECDINTIVKRFGLTGQLPQNVRVPLDADFVGVFDFHSAMQMVRDAQESFMEMPAAVRSRFDNDAGKFVAFCSDAGNADEALKLGIVVKREVAPAEQAPKAQGAPQDAPKPPQGASSGGSPG